MKKIISLFFAIIFTAFSGQAFADLSNKLQGDYAYTSNRICIQNSAGFGSELENLSTAHTRSTKVHGTWSFYGNGHAELFYTGSRLRHDRNGINQANAVLTFKGKCTATYTVNFDNSFVLNPSCRSETLTGTSSNIGGITEVTGVQLSGLINEASKTITVFDTDSNVESVVFTRVNGTVFNNQRICTRSGFAGKR